MSNKQSSSIYSFIYKYMVLARLHKPQAVLLLVLPAFWSLALNIKYSFNNGLLNEIYLYTVLLLGAFIARGFGCVINDIFDRKIDIHVERTKNRPVAKGDITVFGAVVFAVILGILAFLILLTFNKFAIFVGAISVILIIIYPLTKRFTYYPQVFLGFPFAWGILFAEAALNGYLSTITIILYIAGILWVIAYDSIYAIQDYKYDQQHGIKSIVVLYRERIASVVAYLYIAVIVLLFLIGYLIQANFLYYIVLILVMLHFIWQVVNINLNRPEIAWVIFKYNIHVGFLIWVAFLLA
ncbi:4-hydroxybenzoate octaprenyltransferase [Rickettsiales bacterium LUAb2]